MNHTIKLIRAPGSPFADHRYRVRCTCGLTTVATYSHDDAKAYGDRHVKKMAIFGVVR